MGTISSAEMIDPLGRPEPPAHLAVTAPEGCIALFVGPLDVHTTDARPKRRQEDDALAVERRIHDAQLVLAEEAAGLRVEIRGQVVATEHRFRRDERHAEGAGHEHQCDGLVRVVLDRELAGAVALEEPGRLRAERVGRDQSRAGPEERQQDRTHGRDGGEVLLALARHFAFEPARPGGVSEEDAVAVVNEPFDGFAR